jgi:hypothetical protein
MMFDADTVLCDAVTRLCDAGTMLCDAVTTVKKGQKSFGVMTVL